MTAARAAFEAKPPPDTCRHWIDAEARRSAVFAVEQELRAMLGEKRRTLLSTPEAKGRMADAFAEIRAGLTRRREQVVADDLKRSEENGITEVSTSTLAEIDRQVDAVDAGVSWVEPDASRAAGALQTLIGT